MEYKKTALYQPLEIKDLISAHYFEYAKDFAFSGEVHDFWELVYADKGDFFITAGTRELLLSQGQMYLHKPMEYHNIRCRGSASNSVIFSFACACPSLFGLAGRLIDCGERERELLARLVAEADGAFSSPLGDPYVYCLERRETAPFGAEQLIRLYLEELLIGLVRKNGTAAPPEPHAGLPRRRAEETLCREICAYLERQVSERVDFPLVCRVFSLSPSALKKLFRERLGLGVMEYYRRAKIERAKLLIREETLNMTEIAAKLGYSSIHYFSRHFKRLTGMTPTEYAASVKALRQEVFRRQSGTGR